MSSDRFEVKLTPDPLLRRAVLVSGVAGGLLGSWLIIDAELPLIWRLLLLSGWLGRTGYDLSRQRRGYDRVAGVILAASGQTRTLSPDGQTVRTTLLTGSVVYPRIAWLRLRAPDGRHHGELFTAARSGPDSWHRLQLIWQQSRERFGQQGGA